MLRAPGYSESSDVCVLPAQSSCVISTKGYAWNHLHIPFLFFLSILIAIIFCSRCGHSDRSGSTVSRPCSEAPTETQVLAKRGLPDEHFRCGSAGSYILPPKKTNRSLRNDPLSVLTWLSYRPRPKSTGLVAYGTVTLIVVHFRLFGILIRRRRVLAEIGRYYKNQYLTSYFPRKKLPAQDLFKPSF
jgi:hypothetical protein